MFGLYFSAADEYPAFPRYNDRKNLFLQSPILEKRTVKKISEIVKNALIREKILMTDGFLLSVSGGVDSMVLLDVFAELKREAPNLKLSVFHFNHLTRPGENEAEAALVQSVCVTHGIPFFYEQWESKNEIGNFQNEAREKRKQLLEKIRKETESTFIVTAHHADDQIETQLQRIFKGGSLTNLKGMSAVSGHYFRPFLEISKQEILHYADENKIQFLEDSSNETDHYERNRLRQSIIPKLTEFYGDQWRHSLQHVADQSSLLNRNISDFYKTRKNDIVTAVPEGFKIVFPDPQPYFESFYIGFLKLFFEDIGYSSIGYLQSAEIFAFYQKGKRGDRFSLTTGTTAIKSGEGILIQTQLEASSPNIRILIKAAEKRPEQLAADNLTITIDAEKLIQPLSIRTRKDGDLFRPLGMTGEQKLSDFFINRKIDSYRRNQIPLIIDAEGDIIWIYGIEISDKIKITSKTKKFITLNAEEI